MSTAATPSAAPGPDRESGLVQIVYVSSATDPWPVDQLKRSLETFRANNERRGITGLLLHHDGNFMQVIEGPIHEVEALEKRIAVDRRHVGFMVLIKRTITEREFDRWSMAFQNLSNQDLSSFPGWSDFLSPERTHLVGTETQSRALRLLQSFRSSIRR